MQLNGLGICVCIIIIIGKLISFSLLCSSTYMLSSQVTDFKDKNLICETKTKKTYNSKRKKSESRTQEDCENRGDDYLYTITNSEYLCLKEEGVTKEATKFDDPGGIIDEFSSHSLFWYNMSGGTYICICVFLVVFMLWETISYWCLGRFYSHQNREIGYSRFIFFLYLSIYWIGATAGCYIVLAIHFNTCMEVDHQEHLDKAFKWRPFGFSAAIIGLILFLPIFIWTIFLSVTKTHIKMVIKIIFHLFVILPFAVYLIVGFFYAWIFSNLVTSLGNRLMLSYCALILIFEVAQLLVELLTIDKENKKVETDDNIRDTTTKEFAPRPDPHQRDAPPLSGSPSGIELVPNMHSDFGTDIMNSKTADPDPITQLPVVEHPKQENNYFNEENINSHNSNNNYENEIA